MKIRLAQARGIHIDPAADERGQLLVYATTALGAIVALTLTVN